MFLKNALSVVTMKARLNAACILTRARKTVFDLTAFSISKSRVLTIYSYVWLNGLCFLWTASQTVMHVFSFSTVSSRQCFPAPRGCQTGVLSLNQSKFSPFYTSRSFLWLHYTHWQCKSAQNSLKIDSCIQQSSCGQIKSNQS